MNKYILKKWWFWIIIFLVICIIYFLLWIKGLVPIYQCSSTMGPEGPVKWCGWYKGIIGIG